MYSKWELTEWGKQVEALRKERIPKMSKADLCDRLDISVTYYDFIIHGQRTGYCQRDKILEILTDPAKEAS